MAFGPPQSGWTALGISPNPDKFAAAHVNIDRVAQPAMQLQRSVMPAVTPPVTSPALTPAYGQLQQSIFPSLQSQQLAAAQAATQAPASAYQAVEKSLQAEPWTKPSATTMPQSNFLSPTTGTKAPQSGWVGSLPQI